FVYRVTVGDVPLVTNVFPLGACRGQETTVKLTGWNLPVNQLTVNTKNQPPGVHEISVGEYPRVSNRVPLEFDTLGECLEQEPNDRPDVAQSIRPPAVVNGHIGHAGDWDIFRFKGRAGGRVVIDVAARRLGSPLDSVMELTDANGRQLQVNDDHKNKADGLSTHHADSHLMATLPESGVYYLRLGDVQHQGGEAYAYRLRISAARPDFELRVVPSTINATRGSTVPITVYAIRKDGFSGDIALALKDPPAGFTLSGGRVPAGCDKIRLTLTVPPESREEPFQLNLEGRAVIRGRQIVRAAVPAEDMMQAFLYRHFVPVDHWMVAVLHRRWRCPPLRVLSEKPVELPEGSTAEIEISTPRRLPIDDMQFLLNEPPEGISIEDVSPTQRGAKLRLRADAAKIKAGAQGNLIVDVFLDRVAQDKKAKQLNKRRRVPLGTVPAISYEIVTPKELAKP
ncbi:MAG: PPC domain-containing protein, partial [Pirellulales bacterium]|nr:PPC domain-containing protein [Pirellulales bacterium]